MAKIIVLEKWREMHPNRLPGRATPPVEGKVLIYTGVRYERHDSALHHAPDLVPVRAES